MPSSTTSPSFSNATLPAFSVVHRRRIASPALYAGWLGIVAVVSALVVAGLTSSTDVHAVESPVPFLPVAAAIAGAVALAWRRAKADVDDVDSLGTRVFATAGMVLLFAWLSTALAHAYPMNWGRDPLLLRLIETLHHTRDAASLLVFATATVALTVAAGTRMELAGYVVVACLCSRERYGALVFALIVVSCAVCARSMTWRTFGAVVVVTMLALSLPTMMQLDGYGRFYGEIVAEPAMVSPLWPACCALVLLVEGGRRWRTSGGGFVLFVIALVLVPIALRHMTVVRSSGFDCAAILVLLWPPRRATIAAIAVVVVTGCVRTRLDEADVVFELVLAALLCGVTWAMMAQREVMTRFNRPEVTTTA